MLGSVNILSDIYREALIQFLRLIILESPHRPHIVNFIINGTRVLNRPGFTGDLFM